MNKHLLIIGITLLLITTGLSGCIDEKPTEKLITTPLNTLALTLGDLPEGYIEQIKESEDYNISDRPIYYGIMVLEEHSVRFTPETIENKTVLPTIALYLYKFNSSEDAHVVLNNMSELESASLAGTFIRTTPQNVTQIGDESSYELFQSSNTSHNATYSYIYFRIANFVVFILLNFRGMSYVEIDFVNLTINYAEIVESKINSKINTNLK